MTQGMKDTAFLDESKIHKECPRHYLLSFCTCDIPVVYQQILYLLIISAFLSPFSTLKRSELIL